MEVAVRESRPASQSTTLDPEEKLTTRQVALLLKVSESFLAKGRLNGTGPRYRKYGRAVRYRLGDVFEWDRARAHSSTAEY